ncbi:hypothetical protein N9A71_02485 [Porticoccaceae bacterium]|nr:hypothetical protein [Porticoccaceae bacterium]
MIILGYRLVVIDTMKLCAFLSIFLISTGCSYFVSWDEKSKRAIGRPIENYIRLNGPPDKLSPTENGSMEYKYWLKNLDPSCIHYWVVDKEGTIIGYRYEGRCRPIG